MELYKLFKILRNNGYELIRFYPNKEIWAKGEKSLTIPTNCDTLNKFVAKQILAKL